MNAARFAAVRRRVLDDALFRSGLRGDFERTLVQEGLREGLTEAQCEDLHLGLLLHDALRIRDRRPIGPGRHDLVATVPAPWVERAGSFRPRSTEPAEPAGREPVDIGAWRSRRAR
jgi:hypothetical protein